MKRTDLSTMASSLGSKSMLLKCALIGALAPMVASEPDENQSNPFLRKRIVNVHTFEDIWEYASAKTEIETETERLLEENQRELQMSMSFATRSPSKAPTGRPTPAPVPTVSPRPTNRSSAQPSATPTSTPMPSTPTVAPTRERVTPSPSAAPTTPAPTITPRPSPSPTELCYDSTLEEFLLEILSPITNPSILQDPSTPQGMAFDYMVNDDPYLRNPCGKPTIEERYGLTTLYFATNGDSWTNREGWLGEEQECAWFGVECDENNLVTKLQLCKSRFCIVLVLRSFWK
jgi:hypothetical protein